MPPGVLNIPKETEKITPGQLRGMPVLVLSPSQGPGEQAVLLGMRGAIGHAQSGNPCFGAAVPCMDIYKISIKCLCYGCVFLSESSGTELTPGTVSV